MSSLTQTKSMVSMDDDISKLEDEQSYLYDDPPAIEPEKKKKKKKKVRYTVHTQLTKKYDSLLISLILLPLYRKRRRSTRKRRQRSKRRNMKMKRSSQRTKKM